MSRRAVVLFGMVLALALVGLWWWRRERDPRRGAAAATTMAPSTSPAMARGSGAAPTAGTPAATATPAGHLRRLADAAARDRLIADIKAARARRERAAAATPAAGAAPPSTGSGAAPAELSSDDLLASLMEAVPLLKECYSEAQPRLPRAGGKVSVAMSMSGEPDIGTVIDDATLSSDAGLVKDAEFSRCLHETLMSIELAPMRAGGSQAFSIDVDFGPDEPVDGGAPR